MTLFAYVKTGLKVLRRFKGIHQIQTMDIERQLFVVRYERNRNNIEMIFSYSALSQASTKEREFRLNRRLDETIGKTFEKLVFSVEKHTTTKKKRKVDESQMQIVDSCANSPTVQLCDHSGQLVPVDTVNEIAWKEDYRFYLNEREYRVVVDLPHVKKIALSKIILAGMPTLISIDLPDECSNKCFFSWYHSDTDILPENWYLIDEGVDKRFCLLKNDFEKKLIKVKCTPNDGTRNGLPVELTSQSCVKRLFDIDELPMTKRHAMTTNKLAGGDLRVVTYNLLAHAYSDTATAKIHFYPYCSQEYLDFKYRRILLTHEIINYNADIVFLQECDETYFENELKYILGSMGYSNFIKLKGEAKEGEAILFRHDRFRFVKNYDIKLTDEIKNNPLFANIWKNIQNSEEDMTELIENRNTILQVVLIESRENPGKYILLANTHLFFHPKADFIRLLQSLVIVKHLERILTSLKSDENKICTLLMGGDMNSDPGSYAFNYILSQQIPFESLDEGHRKLFGDFKDTLMHSLKISTYTGFQYTNYMEKFNGVLDYIFYDNTSFTLNKVLPMPDHNEVTEDSALPSRKIPSDHLAVVVELKWNKLL